MGARTELDGAEVCLHGDRAETGPGVHSLLQALDQVLHHRPRPLPLPTRPQRDDLPDSQGRGQERLRVED